MSSFSKVEMSSKLTHLKGVCDGKGGGYFGEDERIEKVKSD